MKIYVYDYSSFAGHWIYRGYQAAWQALGYDVVKISPHESLTSAIPDLNEEYMIMLTDSGVSPDSIETIARSQKAFVYVQPNTFPQPWGTHPNFVSLAPLETIGALNNMDNAHLWTFTDYDAAYYNKWKKVNTIPLAFDSVGYEQLPDEKYKKFDISFVGGWANNGFNEKRKIMVDIFSKFMNSDLNCGFFVGKNLTHEQECKVLHNSRVTLNVHDAYQRILGLDTNERTFKSLGLNGCLVSDTVGQLNRLFPQLKTSLEADELVQITKDYLSLTEVELNDIKEHNRQMVMDNHCYTHRVKSLLKL
tara:strand:- start:8385 stop:9302 length:918 start_codon:yes stop_codon:yes gene_type:complete